jgi:two-component system, chemotaxis family, CheB/CheR fusion protein
LGSGKTKGSADMVRLLDQLLLDRFGPPSAIIQENGEILSIHGRTGAYLEPSPGKPSMNILAMARDGLRAELLTAIRQALSQSEEVIRQGIKVKSNGDYSIADLSVARLEQPEALRGLLLVTIRPVRSEKILPATEQALAPLAITSREQELERELQETKAILQTTIERLETTNEELTSTNEELQSTNEESQSVNEELETTKEEMQSLNEELQSVNSELEGKVAELSRANDDIVNLLNATEIGTLFLDSKLRITRFTPPIKKVVNVIASDIGRPISDITFNLDNSPLLKDCEDVLAALTPKESEVRTLEGAWFLMRISVYRTTENVIAGVVLTFSDITRLKAAVKDKLLSESIIQTIREPFLILDSNLKVVQANSAFLQMFHISHAEVFGRLVYDLGDGQWDIPQLRELLERVLPADSSFEDFRVEHEFPLIGKRIMLLNARRVVQESSQSPFVFLAFQDVSTRP